jgi:heat shock protein HslJ
MVKYIFLLLTLACSSFAAQESKILFVAPQLADCTGVGPQKCMLVKEALDDEWSYFYDQIEGFTFEEGYSYELLVNEIPVPNPAADASSLRYELKNIISKTPALNSDDLLKEWTVIKIKGLEQLTASPTMIFEKEDFKVAGFAGCNTYFSTYTISGNTLSLGPAGATRKLCPDMSVEDVFFKNLPDIARYEIIKKELYLYDQRDELLILAISQ